MLPSAAEIVFYTAPEITVNPEQLAALHRRCFTTFWDHSAWKELIARPSAILGVLNISYHYPIGIILIDRVDNECEILTFCIDPSYQRYGYGRALIETLIKSCPCYQYSLEVATDNIAAIKLYQAIGFRTVSVRKSYYHEHGNVKDAVIMSYVSA